MGIILTSRSRLLNQTVRVDRRTTVADGLGGGHEEWSTIIARYHVRIYPDHHQQVVKHEFGELAETTHSAVGSRSMNGKTIMPGDRFIDVVHNEQYAILAVIRPAHGDPRNAITQFRMRLISDTAVPLGGTSGITS